MTLWAKFLCDLLGQHRWVTMQSFYMLGPTLFERQKCVRSPLCEARRDIRRKP